MYRYSVVENKDIKKHIYVLLESSVIKLSNSPCGSLVVLISKKDGGWRMCINDRALNKITLKNRYPFPIIDNLEDQLKHAYYFIKLDLKYGYHQLQIQVKGS